MTDEIPPALSPEEWTNRRRIQGDLLWLCGYSLVGHSHAVAALCLHEQPFGFTHEELSMLMKATQHTGCNCGENQCWSDADQALLDGAVLKVAALLPPRVIVAEPVDRH